LNGALVHGSVRAGLTRSPVNIVEQEEGEVDAPGVVLVAHVPQEIVDVLFLPDVCLHMLLEHTPFAAEFERIAHKQENAGGEHPAHEEVDLDVHPLGIGRVEVGKVIVVTIGEVEHHDDRAEVRRPVREEADDLGSHLGLLLKREAY